MSVLCKLLYLTQFLVLVNSDYWSDRQDLIDLEQSRALGSSLILDSKEQQVNDILMNLKLEEWNEGFADPQQFLPAIHFFQSKRRVENSKVFKFIKKVPKGALLHGHDTSLNDFDYLYNLTYRENLYACYDTSGNLQFHFFGDEVNTTSCDWKLVKTLRAENSSFDAFLKSQLTLIVDDPYEAYPNINIVWGPFAAFFNRVNGLVGYRPIFQEYFYETLKEFYEDNVLYLEVRASLPTVYELNGTTYSREEVVALYQQPLAQFKRDYPDFHGARLIWDAFRRVDNATADQYVVTMKNLKRLYKDFVAGFDLDAQEDRGKPLRDFHSQLMELAKDGVKFFFHAGETAWNGATDLNLVDAILMNATRIGHGYGIVKHPVLMRLLKQKDIAIEINPISNQVLTLVKDLRNHPGNLLFADDFPIVISCDNPTFWGVRGLSYDWYMAFMGLASKSGDLKVLKQLALNSLKYSAMCESERDQVLVKWQAQWDLFLDDALQTKWN